ncbi:MAG: CYTH domain-containing protein [Candidatus Gracilibacteria bacterium]|nr:CYTH domain-containing protein [Candidatus Gracilibacteria bacterium]
MHEIEVKILEIDKDFIIQKLESMGAKLTFCGEIENEFYQNNDGKRIRLRKMGGKNIMTLKTKIENENMKASNEYEVEFLEYETFKIILENVGFKFSIKTNKQRISYHLGEIAFDIDDFPGIPTFIEVEAQTTKNVIKGVELLGYTMDDTKTFGERELKEYYNLI